MTLNFRDHSGRVYFPEVMWNLFHSVVGCNDRVVKKSEQVKRIMRKLKRKYKGLGRVVTHDRMCGFK